MMTRDADEVEGISSERALVSIEVEKLFGVFTYKLRAKQESKNLLILYGDNGLGKSTILECIYHLLSPAPNAGHRSFISEVQFKRFAVTFTEGWAIHLERPQSSRGDYEIICIEPGSTDQTKFSFESERHRLANSQASVYSSFLRKLNLEIFFLRADRTFTTDSHAQARRAERGMRRQMIAYEGTEVYLSENDADERHSLRTAISRANDYIRRKSSRAANAGGASANSIYEDVLKKSLVLHVR